MKKLLILLLLVIALANGLKADMPMGEFPYVATSPSGMCYFEMIPPRVSNGVRKEASGVAYRLSRDGSSKELWQTDGWYSLKVFLSEDGSYLVRMGPWNLGQEPSKNDLAVAFYKDGNLLKQYSTTDLVKDKTKVVRSASHYAWLASDIQREKQIFSGKKIHDEESEPSLFLDNTLHLKTCDDIVYIFDVKTGDIKSSNPAGNQ
jgi:hypothetical protein